MENASKALLIAGSILIGLIIMTMLILMFNRLANVKQEQEEIRKMEQLTAFNQQFEAYNKSVMYGTDIITLINKVVENNKNAYNNTEYKITVFVDGKEMLNSDSMVGTDQETYIYKCSQILYNELGRVSVIKIEKKV